MIKHEILDIKEEDKYGEKATVIGEVWEDV